MFLNIEPKSAVPAGVVIVDAPAAVEQGVRHGTTAASVDAENVTTSRVKIRSDSAFELYAPTTYSRNSPVSEAIRIS